MYINYIFENESCFKNNRVVSLNIFVVISPSESLKWPVDPPRGWGWEGNTSRCTPIYGG